MLSFSLTRHRFRLSLGSAGTWFLFLALSRFLFLLTLSPGLNYFLHAV